MEYADSGDLYAKITNSIKTYSHFTEEQIWRIFIQTVRGLQTLHERKVLHRDLKVPLNTTIER